MHAMLQPQLQALPQVRAATPPGSCSHPPPSAPSSARTPPSPTTKTASSSSSAVPIEMYLSSHQISRVPFPLSSLFLASSYQSQKGEASPIHTIFAARGVASLRGRRFTSTYRRGATRTQGGSTGCPRSTPPKTTSWQRVPILRRNVLTADCVAMSRRCLRRRTRPASTAYPPHPPLRHPWVYPRRRVFEAAGTPSSSRCGRGTALHTSSRMKCSR